MVSFRSDAGVRFNVYYTTGTVGTCLDHPVQGKTQLFRRTVTVEELGSIFDHPRMHTGRGYQRKKRKTSQGTGSALAKAAAMLPGIGDEEAEVRAYIKLLEAKVRAGKAHLNEILEGKEAIRKRAAEEQRAKAQREREDAQRREEARRIQVLKEEQKAKNTILNRRGNNYDYSLVDNDYFPPSMKDVKELCLSPDGGYIALLDNGTTFGSSYPNEISKEVDRQKNSNIEYIAVGSVGQYYLSKFNGKSMWSGCSAMSDILRSSNKRVEFISFGNWETYYIQFVDGSSDWGGDISYNLENDLQHNKIQHLWLSRNSEQYIVLFKDGGRVVCVRDELPGNLNRILESKSVKRLFMRNKVFPYSADKEYPSYLVRYS